MKSSNATPLLILVIALVASGCMTNAVAKRGAGTRKDYVRDETVEGGYRTIEYPPQPLYFVLVPLTVPLDIATSPFQLVGVIIGVGTHSP